MDNYIKMCDCAEIQNGWGLSDGDRVAFKNQFRSGYTVGYYPAVNQFWLPHIWLPSQEDLQAMFTLAYSDSHYRLMRECWEFALTSDGCKFETLTELWLAFVMHELYGLEWNGTKWIKEK